MTRAVWWVIALAIFVILVLLVFTFVIVAVVVRDLVRAVHKKNLEKQTCIFNISRCNVTFVGLGDGIEVSTKTVHFDEKLPLDYKVQCLFCVGKAGKSV